MVVSDIIGTPCLALPAQVLLDQFRHHLGMVSVFMLDGEGRRCGVSVRASSSPGFDWMALVDQDVSKRYATRMRWLLAVRGQASALERAELAALAAECKSFVAKCYFPKVVT